MQRKAKLPKFTRLTVYSYLNTTALLLRISCLDSTTRKDLPGSGIACTNRDITINIPLSVFNCDNCQICQKEEQHPVKINYLVSLVSHVNIKLNPTYRNGKHLKVLVNLLNQYKPNNSDRRLSIEVYPSKFG